MKPDLIFANSPYGKPGVEITKYIMENFPDANYAMLNTRSAFKKYYDKLACAFVQIGRYELGTNKKLDWGVQQAILLATNGRTEVIDNRKKAGENKVGIENMTCLKGFHTGRISHLVGVGKQKAHQCGFNDYRTATLVGVNEPYVYRTGTLAPRRTTCLVGVDRPRIDHTGSMGRSRTATLVQTNNNPTETKLRNGYIYVSFETFEEACECAVDIISWTDPTDSHYRCVRWGFVTGLRSHERYKEEGEQK